MANSPTDQQDHNQWFVLGAGALGCLWAAMLAECGSNVTVIVRDANQKRRHKVQLRYTRLQGGFQHAQRQNLQPKAAGHSVDANSELPTTRNTAPDPTAYPVAQATLSALANEGITITNLLVTTKSYDALTAIEAALPLLETDARVLTLCNGYGLHQPIAELLHKQQRGIALYAGVSSDGALLRGQLDVVHTGMGTTKIGRFGGETITRYLPAALPLAVDYVDDVQSSILQKFFINCAINPLTAVHDCKNGELLSEPGLYRVFQQLCRELQNIYQAMAQDLCNQQSAISRAGFDVLQQASQVAAATADNQSSMLQDYRRRRRLELQYLNSEAIVLARRFSIACPINESLVSQLQPASG